MRYFHQVASLGDTPLLYLPHPRGNLESETIYQEDTIHLWSAKCDTLKDRHRGSYPDSFGACRIFLLNVHHLPISLLHETEPLPSIEYWRAATSED